MCRGRRGPPAGQCRRRRPSSRSRGASGRRSEPVGEHVADALEHPAQLLGDRQVRRRQRRLDELIEHRRHQLGPAAVSTVDGRPRDARAGSDRVRPRRGDGTAQRGKRCKLTGSGAVGRMIAAAGWCAPAPGDLETGGSRPRWSSGRCLRRDVASTHPLASAPTPARPAASPAASSHRPNDTMRW